MSCITCWNVTGIIQRQQIPWQLAILRLTTTFGKSAIFFFHIQLLFHGPSTFIDEFAGLILSTIYNCRDYRACDSFECHRWIIVTLYWLLLIFGLRCKLLLFVYNSFFFFVCLIFNCSLRRMQNWVNKMA